MGGGMEAQKNRWIEDWSTARENLEHNFRWSRRNLALVGLFGIAIPVLVCKGIVRDFWYPVSLQSMCFSGILGAATLCIYCQMLHMQDEDAGRPYRKFL